MNKQPKEWVLASSNLGKLNEFQALFRPLQIHLRGQTELGVQACEEPYFTFIENALLKARHASAHTQCPALADDSGLCVPALNGAPGVYSARFSQLHGGPSGDSHNNDLLIQKLTSISDWQAYYVCALAWVEHERDPTPIVVQRFWWGQVQPIAKGNHGFGYDPHFYLPQFGCTAAQLPSEKKNQVSHRALAMQALMHELTGRLQPACG